jgi:hypothetical protein
MFMKLNEPNELMQDRFVCKKADISILNKIGR